MMITIIGIVVGFIIGYLIHSKKAIWTAGFLHINMDEGQYYLSTELNESPEHFKNKKEIIFKIRNHT